jgi:hypothetical protein
MGSKMNERIRELWEEATVSTWPRPGKFTAGEYDYHLEKFAELIIRDCAEMMPQDNLYKMILKRFGVEE